MTGLKDLILWWDNKNTFSQRAYANDEIIDKARSLLAEEKAQKPTAEYPDTHLCTWDEVQEITKKEKPRPCGCDYDGEMILTCPSCGGYKREKPTV